MVKQRFWLLAMFLILGLCGCKSNEYMLDGIFASEEKLPEYDVQNEYVYPGGMICEYKETIYTVSDLEYIVFIDENGESGELCGKPECMHNVRSCNANVVDGAFGLRVYEGKLYWVGSDPAEFGVLSMYLWRMDLDGTNREKLKEMQPFDVNTDIIYMIHRGCIYIAGINAKVEDARAMQVVQIYAEPMVGDGIIEILSKEYLDTSVYCRTKMVGTQMYIMISTIDSSGQYGIELYVWNGQTGKLKTILIEGNIGFSAWDIWIQNGTIYISTRHIRGDNSAEVYLLDDNKKMLLRCFSFEDNIYTAANITENAVVSIGKNPDGTLVICAKNFEGNTLFEKSVKIEGLSMERRYGRRFIGGTEGSLKFVFIDHETGQNYIVAFTDSSDEGQILWTEERA